jgi:predicted amidohydrolase YtcJ
MACGSTAAEPVDVLLAGGRVLAIGDLAATGLAEVIASAEPVELAGRFLLPGLWDRHVHMRQQALARHRLDLSGAASAAEVVSLVRDRAAAGEPVLGYGFRDGLWPDAPHRDLLDAAAPAVPVILSSGDLHCGWLNTLALERFGHGGHPTGLLREDDWYPIGRTADQVTEATLDGWIAEASAAAAARGVVGIVELEQAANPDEWTRRVAAGNRFLRVACGVYEPHLEDAIARGLRTGDPLPGTDGLVTMGPFKGVTDGSLNTRTAFCHDPYPAWRVIRTRTACSPCRTTVSSC